MATQARRAETPRRSPRRGTPARDAAEVLVWLRRVIRAVDIHSKRVAKASGMTIPQIVILQAVERLGEVTASRLSAEVDLSPPTVSTILDRLESRGYIERYRSSVDRRVVHTRLTPQGRRALRHAPPLLQDRFSRAFAGLRREDGERIVRSLREVAEMMGAAEMKAGPILTVDHAAGGAAKRAGG